MFRSLKNKFKVKIYKDDLKYVFINGLLAGIFLGLACGAGDILLALLNIPVSIFIYLLGMQVGKKVAKSYYSYHILYPILAVVFSILGLFFYNTIKIIYIIGDIKLVFEVFSFSTLFKMFLSYFNPIGDIYNLLNFIVVILMLVSAFRIAKSNN